jgi:mannose-6-phosphate isomerase-like protein (cupin superfamily)
MIDVTVKQFDELEQHTGNFQAGQQFLYAGKSLGVSAWGMNIIRMPPNWDEYPEHDHVMDVADGQEEVYVVLSGNGKLKAGEESWSIAPGTLVRVGPAQKRKLVPGDEGLTVLALGGTPGKAYVPPSWQIPKE